MRIYPYGQAHSLGNIEALHLGSYEMWPRAQAIIEALDRTTGWHFKAPAILRVEGQHVYKWYPREKMWELEHQAIGNRLRRR